MSTPRVSSRSSTTLTTPPSFFAPDCICPDECCGCGGSTRACICNVPDESEEAA